MAIGSGGINGGFSGKAGSLVGYYRMGKWIVRGLPKAKKKKKKGTPAQKASRSLFTKMQHFLGPIVPIIRVGFNMEGRSKQMTAHNAAKSYNMLHAFTPEGEIDCSKVLISYGKLPGSIEPTIRIDDAGIHVSWTNNSSERGANPEDQVMILVYNVSRYMAFPITSGNKRFKGHETIELPVMPKDTVWHVWISFISEDRMSVSMSDYLGEIAY